MSDLSHYEKEVRPWGNFERFTLNESTTVKIITVQPGEALSLQTHTKREEFWRVLSGSGQVTIGEMAHAAKEGDEFFVHTNQAHRVEASADGIRFLEIAFGTFDERDITRLDDRYGRS